MKSYSGQSFAEVHNALAAQPDTRDVDGEPRLDGLRVLVVTSGHDVRDARIYAKQVRSLQRFGARVTIVGQVDGSKPSDVHVLSVAKPASRLMRFLFQPWRCLWTARTLSPDVIHFHDAEMLITLPVARLWWRRAKFVYDVHEDFANLMLVRDWIPIRLKPLVRAITNVVEKGLALLADAIVAVTPPLADKFRNRERIVAYNYVAEQFFAQAANARAPRDREFDLVHLGTLSLPRSRFLAQTLWEIQRLRPATRSLVVGLSMEIEKEFRESVPPTCIVRGKVPHEQIPQLLGNSKIGLDVHPWLGPHLEVALPVKVFEYMAAKCAVISSSMPMLQRVLEDAEVAPGDIGLITGGTPSDYAKKVISFLKAIEDGKDPGNSLRNSAIKHMVWEREARKIGHLYRRLAIEPCAS